MPSDEPPGSRTALDHHRLEEELLQAAQPAVRVTIVRAPALSIGIGVPEGADYVVRAREIGLPIVRRTTGGTGILHAPGDLLWSVVLPRGDPRIGPDLASAYARLGAGVVDWLAAHAIRSAWIPAPGLSASCCPLGPRGRALTIDDRVLSGAAQHLTSRGFLHHGSLPRRIDRAQHAEVFGLRDPEETGRLLGTSDLGIDEPPAAIAGAVERAIERRIGLG